MKSSPAKGLKDFFQGLGKKGTEARQTKQKETNEGGLTNFEKRQAERATQRKTGESKFKTDVKERKEETKRRKNDPLLEEIKDTSELKVGEGIVEGPKEKPKTKPKTKSKVDWGKAPKLNTQARRDWYTANNLAQDSTTALKKNSPAKNYKKGYYKK